ncbi:MAG: hypothetical protein AB7P04_05755 [Bacteriovoracia bacterium]
MADSKFVLLHYRKNQEARPLNLGTHGLFFVDTCQRYFWLGNDPLLARRLAEGFEGFDLFEGEAAYDFLLRIACGLESAVIGETDIFGQIKEAWAKFEKIHTRPVPCQSHVVLTDLRPRMQRLFEDTKEIRSTHLQGLGGGSYGTLVRKALPAPSEGKLFILGAGKIAYSVVPYLLEHELVIWNRSLDKAFALAEKVKSLQPQARVSVVEDEKDGWEQSGHALLCIPHDAQADQARAEGLGEFMGTVLHLGCAAAEKAVWSPVTRFLSIDDLFALQNSLHSAKSQRVQKALAACAERAKLRFLAAGDSANLPHGWEDLAAFG